MIEIATGREHGPYDSEADVALCLVFEKLGREQVEVLCDASPMATMTAPSRRRPRPPPPCVWPAGAAQPAARRSSSASSVGNRAIAAPFFRSARRSS